MTMGVVGQSIGPGMEHSQHTDFATHIFRVGRKLHKGLCRRPHENGVQGFLVTAHNPAQFRRQGEHHVEIDDLQQLGSPFIQPPLRIIAVALGTTAIFAGMIGIIQRHAMVAFHHMAAKSLGAAVDDIPESASMTGEHVFAEAGDILRPVSAKNVRQFRHDFPDCLRVGHELVNGVEYHLFPLMCKVSIDGGCVGALVPEQHLDIT